MFKNVHPTPTAGRNNVAPSYTDGRTLAKDQSDNTRRNCKQCGFPVDTRRNARGSGTGIRHVIDSTSGDYVPDVGRYQGCSKCGSKNY